MFQNTFENAELDPTTKSDVTIVCEICGKPVSRLDYDRHLRTHKEKRVEVCKICFKAFTNISNFKYHMAHHGNDRPWLCNECPKNYKTKIDLLQHQRVHDKARDPFHCDICGQYFKTRSNFNTHQRTHSVRGPQRCEACDKIFVNLRSHIQMVHHKVRTHVCNLCSKAFGKKSGLDRHVITVHEKMRVWACDLCDKSFGEKAQLRRHRNIHFKPTFQEPDPEQITEDQEVIEDEKRRMQCGICKKVVNSRAALKRHKLLIHEKKKNLLCDFCPRMFGEKSNLMRHIVKAHHAENIHEMQELDYTTSLTIERCSLSEQVDSETYSCMTCSKVLTTKWGLRAHEDVCLINQQRKLNSQADADSDSEDGFEIHLKSELPDVDTMEQVFLVSAEDDDNMEIKQEPPFLDDNLSSDAMPKFVTELIDANLIESIGVEIKEEPEQDLCEVADKPDTTPNEDDSAAEFENEIEEDLGSEYIDSDDSDESSKNIKSEEAPEEMEPDVKFLKRYKCKLCPSTFKEKRYFRSHFTTVHGKKKDLMCTAKGCNESFVYRAQRLRHLRLKHPKVYEESEQEDDGQIAPVEEKHFECELCSANFKSQAAVDTHMDNKHDDDEDSVKRRTCEICEPPKIFKKIRYFLLHTQAIHSDQSYDCPQCPKKFSFRCSLGRHIRGVHNDISNYECEESGCEKKFRSSYELKQHQISSHSKGDKSDRTCVICKKIFKKVKYMQIHIASIHNTEPQYFCPICSRGFSFQRSMDRHIKSIHEDRRDFKCSADGCEKAFRSRYDLNEHFNNIHAFVKKVRPIEQVTCDVCEKVCSSRKVLYSHKKMVHEGVKWGTTFECKLCHERFESKYKKSKHWGQVHRNGKVKTRTCHLCSSDFQLFEEFKQHIESHLGYFMCIICGHNFPDESALFIHHESHRKIEEDLRQYVCDVCSHKLSTKAQLLIHMRKHFSGDYYMCDICGKSYKFIAPFLHHKMGHENRFDFPCRYCEKKFRVSRDRMLHERVHTKERPYKCENCQKTFAHKANYISHLKTHETKAYVCKTCGLPNSSAAKLRQHEDASHPEERPFRCCYCHKSFKVGYSLEAHKLKCAESFDYKFANF